MTQDPIGLGPDANQYRYCENAPTSFADPNGLQTTPLKIEAKRPITVHCPPSDMDMANKEAEKIPGLTYGGKPVYVYPKLSEQFGGRMNCVHTMRMDGNFTRSPTTASCASLRMTKRPKYAQDE